jgi:hypothetical protein
LKSPNTEEGDCKSPFLGRFQIAASTKAVGTHCGSTTLTFKSGRAPPQSKEQELATASPSDLADKGKRRIKGKSVYDIMIFQ